MNAAQILHDLCYNVCSTTLPIFFAFGLFTVVFGISAIIHQQLVATPREHLRFVFICVPTRPDLALDRPQIKMPNLNFGCSMNKTEDNSRLVVHTNDKKSIFCQHS